MELEEHGEGVGIRPGQHMGLPRRQFPVQRAGHQRPGRLVHAGAVRADEEDVPRRVETGVRRPCGGTERQQYIPDPAAQAGHGGAACGQERGGALGGVPVAGTGVSGGAEDGEGAQVHGMVGGFHPPEGEVERRQVLGGHIRPLTCGSSGLKSTHREHPYARRNHFQAVNDRYRSSDVRCAAPTGLLSVGGCRLAGKTLREEGDEVRRCRPWPTYCCSWEPARDCSSAVAAATGRGGSTGPTSTPRPSTRSPSTGGGRSRGCWSAGTAPTGGRPSSAPTTWGRPGGNRPGRP